MTDGARLDIRAGAVSYRPLTPIAAHGKDQIYSVTLNAATRSVGARAGSPNSPRMTLAR